MHPHTGVGGGAGAAPHAAPAQTGYSGNPGAAPHTATGGTGYAANPGAGPGGEGYSTNPGIGPGAGTPAPDAAGARPGVSRPAPAGEPWSCTLRGERKQPFVVLRPQSRRQRVCYRRASSLHSRPARGCVRSGRAQFPGWRRPLPPARWSMRALTGRRHVRLKCPGPSWVPGTGTQPGPPAQTPWCARRQLTNAHGHHADARVEEEPPAIASGGILQKIKQSIPGTNVRARDAHEQQAGVSRDAAALPAAGLGGRCLPRRVTHWCHAT